MADNPGSSLGKKIAAFTLPDADGRLVSLDGFKEKKALVIVFIGTECPINNAYMPRLEDLHRGYAPRGVQFLAINANQQDSTRRIAEHAKQFELTIPVLKDQGNHVADLFGAQRTPEAFVLDHDRVIRYCGRIDDQFGVGYKRAQPTRRDLALALDEVLAGKQVSQPTTAVAGCCIARAAKPKPGGEGTITFTKQIAAFCRNTARNATGPVKLAPCRS